MALGGARRRRAGRAPRPAGRAAGSGSRAPVACARRRARSSFEPKVLDQRRAGPRLVDRIEILAGDVLDQRSLHSASVVVASQQRRDRLQPRLAARPPAALAGDQLGARRAAAGRAAAGSARPRRSTRRGRAPRGRSAGAAGRGRAQSIDRHVAEGRVAGAVLGQDRRQALPMPRRALMRRSPRRSRPQRAPLPAPGRRSPRATSAIDHRQAVARGFGDPDAARYPCSRTHVRVGAGGAHPRRRGQVGSVRRAW